MTGPTLSTRRLFLRRWSPADQAPFARINADPAVMAYRFAPLTRRQSDALLDQEEANFDRDGFGLWAVERKRDRRLLGFTGLGRSAFGAPFCPAVDIGWQLARDAWGQGYATEGAIAVLAFAFFDLGSLGGRSSHDEAEQAVASSHAAARHDAQPARRLRRPVVPTRTPASPLRSLHSFGDLSLLTERLTSGVRQRAYLPGTTVTGAAPSRAV
jgi:RimJ/RimL family protein N-acetyltransferase